MNARTSCRSWLFSALLLTACGGAGAGKGAAPDTAPTLEERIRRGLELGEAGDFAGAMTEFLLVQREKPSVAGSLRLANARFMLGNHSQSLAGYRHYLENTDGLSAQERMALAAEIERIERSIDEGERLEGPSLAGQWFGGELARARADEDLARQAFAEALAGYDAAFGHLGYPQYLFEAAVAATLGGKLQIAHDRFADYLRLGGAFIPADLSYAVVAEVDRLAAILAGEPAVTDESLAARIVAERAGSATAEGPPPSVVEEEAIATDAVASEPEPVEPPGEVAAAAVPAGPVVDEPPAYREVEVPPEIAARPPPPRAEPKPVPLEDLLFYARSKSSTVRHRAVRDLARIADERARLALEERVLDDSNLHVRFVAVASLVARRSYRSIPLLRRAMMTAATSDERAVLRRAIDELQN